MQLIRIVDHLLLEVEVSHNEEYADGGRQSEVKVDVEVASELEFVSRPQSHPKIGNYVEGTSHHEAHYDKHEGEETLRGHQPHYHFAGRFPDAGLFLLGDFALLLFGVECVGVVEQFGEVVFVLVHGHRVVGLQRFALFEAVDEELGDHPHYVLGPQLIFGELADLHPLLQLKGYVILVALHLGLVAVHDLIEEGTLLHVEVAILPGLFDHPVLKHYYEIGIPSQKTLVGNVENLSLGQVAVHYGVEVFEHLTHIKVVEVVVYKVDVSVHVESSGHGYPHSVQLGKIGAVFEYFDHVSSDEPLEIETDRRNDAVVPSYLEGGVHDNVFSEGSREVYSFAEVDVADRPLDPHRPAVEFELACQSHHEVALTGAYIPANADLFGAEYFDIEIPDQGNPVFALVLIKDFLQLEIVKYY